MAGTCAEYALVAGACIAESAPLDPATLYGAAKHGHARRRPPRSRGSSMSSSLGGACSSSTGRSRTPGRFVPSIVRALLARRAGADDRGPPAPRLPARRDAGAAFAALAASDVTGAVNVASGSGRSAARDRAEIARASGAEELLRSARCRCPRATRRCCGPTSRACARRSAGAPRSRGARGDGRLVARARARWSRALDALRRPSPGRAMADLLDTGAAGPAALRGSALRTGAYVGGILLSLVSAPLLIRHLGVADSAAT